jgi:protein subunit release factor A
MIEKNEIVAIITIVPALAWFVNAGIYTFKTYRKNEDKIKKVAKEASEDIKEGAKQGAEKIKETAEKVEEKIEKKLYTADPENEKNNQSKPGTEEGSDPH